MMTLSAVTPLLASQSLAMQASGMPLCVVDATGATTYRVALNPRTASALRGRGHTVRECADQKGHYFVWSDVLHPEQCATPQRLTYNSRNPAAGEFLIDEDTPRYCDPACDAYHQM